MDKENYPCDIIDIFNYFFMERHPIEIFSSDTSEGSLRRKEVAPVEKRVEKGIDIKEAKSLMRKNGTAKKKVVSKKEVSIETQNYWAVSPLKMQD